MTSATPVNKDDAKIDDVSSHQGSIKTNGMYKTMKGWKDSNEHRIAIVIGNSEYGELRKDPETKAFGNIPEALTDVKVVVRGLQHIGFDKSEITELINPDKESLKTLFNKVMDQAYMNGKEGKETILFVYFAGHGAMDNDTYIILNGPKMAFPLEKMLRTISKMTGTYVIALLDCCREKLSFEQWRGGVGGEKHD